MSLGQPLKDKLLTQTPEKLVEIIEKLDSLLETARDALEEHKDEGTLPYLNGQVVDYLKSFRE